MRVLAVRRLLGFQIGIGIGQIAIVGRQIVKHLLTAVHNPAHLAAPFDAQQATRFELADIRFFRCTERLGTLRRIPGRDKGYRGKTGTHRPDDGRGGREEATLFEVYAF